MAEPQNSVDHQKEEEKNPFLGFFTSLFSSQQNKKNDGVKVGPAGVERFRILPDKDEDDIEDYNDIGYVFFPRYNFPNRQLEFVAEGAEQTTNPATLWQVYAIGGYYILRWAWMKWNARRGQNDEPPPAFE